MAYRRRFRRGSPRRTTTSRTPPSYNVPSDAKQRDHIRSYDNIESYLDDAKAVTPEGEKVGTRSSREKGNQAFRGSDSFESTLDLAYKGWPEGTEKAKELTFALESVTSKVSYRTKLSREVQGGGTLLIPDHIQGLPDPWLHRQKKKENKFVRIVFNGTASGGVDKEVLVARGTVAAALIDTLELNGYRVKVELYTGVKGNKASCQVTVCLKEFHESLDLDRLVFFVGHPSSLRRLFFSIEENLDADMRGRLNVGYGNGYPIDAPNDSRGDVYFPMAYATEEQWTNTESAQKFLGEKLSEFGISLES